MIDTTLDTIHVVRQGALQLHHPQKVHAYSLHETEAWVGELYAQLKDSWGTQLVVVLLQGDLGAGKTQFTKYLAHYLGITQVVTSPTFTLCNEYQGSVERHTISLYHIDTYRMYDPEELEDLTPQEIFKPPHVVVIEWANKIYERLLPYLTKAIVVEIVITAPRVDERIFAYELHTGH